MWYSDKKVEGGGVLEIGAGESLIVRKENIKMKVRVKSLRSSSLVSTKSLLFCFTKNLCFY